MKLDDLLRRKGVSPFLVREGDEHCFGSRGLVYHYGKQCGMDVSRSKLAKMGNTFNDKFFVVIVCAIHSPERDTAIFLPYWKFKEEFSCCKNKGTTSGSRDYKTLSFNVTYDDDMEEYYANAGGNKFKVTPFVRRYEE